MDPGPAAALPRPSPLQIALILVRVAVIIVVWLGTFLAAFLGYLTLPLVVIAVFLLSYGTLDLYGIRRQSRARRAATAARAPVADDAGADREPPR